MVFRKFGKIVVNRLKVSALDMAMDVLVSSIQEYRRANQEGVFDVHRKSQINPFDERNTVNHPTEQKGGIFNNLFKAK